LKFHDGEPVRSKDAVASLTRWSARDGWADAPAIQNELTAVDDKTSMALKQPYPKMCWRWVRPMGLRFIMLRASPNRPIQAITEYVARAQ